MTIAEIATLLQSGVLSAIAALLVYRAPLIWKVVLDYVERARLFQAEQYAMERASRAEIIKDNAKTLADLTQAIHELRAATRYMCRYGVSPGLPPLDPAKPITDLHIREG